MGVKLKYWLLIMMAAGCYRADDFLYNNDDSIEVYLFDDYPNPNIELPDDYSIPDSLIELLIFNDRGNDIYAVFAGNRTSIPHDTVILYCHGNRDHMDYYWPRVKLLAAAGYSVMTLDYSGFGLSEGKPEEEAMYRQVDLAASWLKEQGLPDEQLVIYGFSLGTAPAVQLSAKPRSLRPEKLILEAPFASAEMMVQDAAALAVPGSFFTDLKINNADLIRSAEQDLLWLHGEADTVQNINTQGVTVFKNYGGTYKEDVRVPGGGHGTLPLDYGLERYIETVRSFIARKED